MKIAVIGSGITGLGAAWALEQGAFKDKGKVVLYESEHRLGGHSNTVDVTLTNPDGSEWHELAETCRFAEPFRHQDDDGVRAFGT